MSKKIAVIGECMIELSQKGAEVSRGFGGDTLNTSVYIARQVAPDALSVSYVTALGTDSFSQQMLEAWQGENVGTSLIQRMENRLPGLYYIETDSTGERTFYYWRNEAAAKFWLESEAAAAICEELATFDYLYLSGISLAILSQESREKLLSLLRECRANGGKVIFDNNYRPRLWASRAETQQVYQQMLECTDIAFLTLDDEDALWGEKPVDEVIARTQAAGVSEVVIKRGVSGGTSDGGNAGSGGAARSLDGQHGDSVSRSDYSARGDACLRTVRADARTLTLSLRAEGTQSLLAQRNIARILV